jgi:hypothetical protein
MSMPFVLCCAQFLKLHSLRSISCVETSKEYKDGRSTSSHDSKKFRTRSVEKQGGIAFGFQKMATAVIKPGR